MNRAQYVILLTEQINEGWASNLATNLASGAHAAKKSIGAATRSTVGATGKGLSRAAQLTRSYAPKIGQATGKMWRKGAASIAKGKVLGSIVGAQALKKGKELAGQTYALSKAQLHRGAEVAGQGLRNVGRKAKLNLAIAGTAGKFNVGQKFSRAGRLLRKTVPGVKQSLGQTYAVTKAQVQRGGEVAVQKAKNLGQTARERVGSAGSGVQQSFTGLRNRAAPVSPNLPRPHLSDAATSGKSLGSVAGGLAKNTWGSIKRNTPKLYHEYRMALPYTKRAHRRHQAYAAGDQNFESLQNRRKNSVSQQFTRNLLLAMEQMDMI